MLGTSYTFSYHRQTQDQMVYSDDAVHSVSIYSQQKSAFSCLIFKR